MHCVSRHGWMKAAAAKATLAQAKSEGITSDQYSQASRYMTEHYFDQGHELTHALTWLHKNGHPKVKVPPLP